jgi:hypothetical protein
MSDRDVTEMTIEEILEEYDAKFKGARAYPDKAAYETAAMRKHQLKHEFEKRTGLTEPSRDFQGIKERRVL